MLYSVLFQGGVISLSTGKFPNQSVACAVPDFSKGQDLEYWIKDAKLLLEQQEEGWLGEYRDPFVWKEEQQFFMLIGTGDAAYGGGNALIYTSTDGKHWMSKGFVMDYSYLNNKEVGHVWELLMLSYYLDYSMIEVYVNHQKSITLRNYIQGEHRTIQITGDPKLKIKSFVLWEMKSAY